MASWAWLTLSQVSGRNDVALTTRSSSRLGGGDSDPLGEVAAVLRHAFPGEARHVGGHRRHGGVAHLRLEDGRELLELLFLSATKRSSVVPRPVYLAVRSPLRADVLALALAMLTDEVAAGLVVRIAGVVRGTLEETGGDSAGGVPRKWNQDHQQGCEQQTFPFHRSSFSSPGRERAPISTEYGDGMEKNGTELSAGSPH